MTHTHGRTVIITWPSGNTVLHPCKPTVCVCHFAALRFPPLQASKRPIPTHLPDLRCRERLEDDELVHTVEELGREVAPDLEGGAKYHA